MEAVPNQELAPSHALKLLRLHRQQMAVDAIQRTRRPITSRGTATATLTALTVLIAIAIVLTVIVAIVTAVPKRRHPVVRTVALTAIEIAVIEVIAVTVAERVPPHHPPPPPAIEVGVNK